MAAYDSTPLRVPMKPCPSATYSNLTGSGHNIFYAHRSHACAVQPATAVARTPIPVRKVECECQDFIHTIKALPHGAGGFLILATEGGIQVWDKPGHHLLFQWGFPQLASQQPAAEASEKPVAAAAAAKSGSKAQAGVGSRHQLFARGACINMAADGSANICFGASSGNLYVLQVDDGGRFTGPHPFTHHKAPITALSSAYQARQGRWTEDLSSSLVSADESGAITVWQASSASSYTPAFELGSAASTTTPAVALAVRTDFVVAGRLDGTIQVYSMRDKSLRADIVAHSRWLTAMDIHPTKDLIVTGAEDGSIGVWTLPIGAQKAVPLLSCVWMHGSVTGVAFCGPTLDDVAAVAYDTDELQVYKLAKPT